MKQIGKIIFVPQNISFELISHEFMINYLFILLDRIAIARQDSAHQISHEFLHFFFQFLSDQITLNIRKYQLICMVNMFIADM